jgi:hypothetical protein
MLTSLFLVGSLSGLILFPETSQGSGRGGGDPSGCVGGGGTVVYAGACPTGAGVVVGPQYVEQTVTRYRCEYREREEEVTVVKMVPREEPYKYRVLVPVMKPEKRKVMEYQTSMVEEPYKYTVIVPVMKPEKRKVIEYQTSMVEEPYKYYEMVPTTTMQTQMQTRYTCVPQTVVQNVPVCRTVTVPVVCQTAPSCCDPCGATVIRYTCQRVMEMQQVTRVVSQMVATQVEVTVPVTTWNRVEREGKRMVCRTTPVEREITVNVCHYERQEREGKRMVWKTTPVEREITVNICTYEEQEREGKRIVYDRVESKEKRKVGYYETVPYTEQVMVAVGGVVDCGAVSYCGGGGGRGLFRGGLFGGRCR